MEVTGNWRAIQTTNMADHQIIYIGASSLIASMSALILGIIEYV
jgi:hypothetical protein